MSSNYLVSFYHRPNVEVASQVVGSLFLFPVGPKFIYVMYHFARFVAVKYIKTHSKSKLNLW